MTITITAYPWVPPFAQGQVRDLRVRWALEEAGLPYRVHLVSPEEKQSVSYRRLQPFAQVPAFEEDGFSLFESGAIVDHVARRSSALSPDDDAGRARMTGWIFAAVSSVEPQVMNVVLNNLFEADTAWSAARRPVVEQAAADRLDAVATWLDTREWLEGDRFTGGDLMMVAVLRILEGSRLVRARPVIADYIRRATVALRSARHWPTSLRFSTRTARKMKITRNSVDSANDSQ